MCSPLFNGHFCQSGTPTSNTNPSVEAVVPLPLRKAILDAVRQQNELVITGTCLHLSANFAGNLRVTAPLCHVSSLLWKSVCNEARAGPGVNWTCGSYSSRHSSCPNQGWSSCTLKATPATPQCDHPDMQTGQTTRRVVFRRS